MARIRTIKPAFFRHRRLFLAERESGLPLRVAFAGLWTVADRDGRFRWEPDEIKLDCLPYDDVDFGEVLDVLHEREFIEKYEVDGRCYGYIPSWAEHQVINQREAQSIFPEPSGATHVHARAHTATSYEPHGANIPEPLRQTVLARDSRKCVRCPSTEDLTIDHIFPRSMGGTHAITNLRTLCRGCNSRRPVAGQAFIDDLAKDGLSMDDMQRMCMHVQGNGEGKGTGREGKGKEWKATRRDASVPSDDFLSFWKGYPRRKGSNPRHTAWLSFSAAIGRGESPERIIAGLRGYSAECEELKYTRTEKVAQAVTWLNQRRWEDYQADALPPEKLADIQAASERGAAKLGYVKVGEKWVKQEEAA